MSLKRSLREFVRCTRHNVLHLKRFKVHFRDPDWVVRYPGGELAMPSYPYLAFHDIEGYLKNGAWDIGPGETVIDAGGCHGEFSLYASKRVGPGGRVLMLEPDQANIAVARQNFAHNGNPANITIVPAGLWHERGVIRFTVGHSAESAVASPDSASAANTVEVPTVTLADLVHDYDLKRLDFVKMDIEGAELEAMSVAKELPVDMRPRFAIASYHPRDGQPTAGKCEAILRDLGYTDVSTGNPRHMTTWAAK